MNNYSSRPDQFYLSVLQKKYLDNSNESENKKTFNVSNFEQNIYIIDKDEFTGRKSNIESCLSIEKNRIFLDYFKYKYDDYKNVCFDEDKIKSIILNDGKNKRSKTEVNRNRPLKFDNIKNFIHR